MDIRSINPGPSSAEAIGTRRAEESDTAKGGHEASAAAARSQEAKSDAVRLTHLAKSSESGELIVARAALAHSEGLSEKRRAQILSRIQSGFYTDPSVTAQVAEKMADQLKGGQDA